MFGTTGESILQLSPAMAMPPPPPPPSPPPREMLLPPSAIATRFATHWIVDALAGDESIDFSVLQALLGASSEPLAGATEATRERVALRSLQELSSLIPAGGDANAAATVGVLRVDGERSCEEVLSRLIKEVEISGKLEKDLLPPFSQDIQEIIRTKKATLPETYFQLLKGVDPWILHQSCMPESRSYVPPQENTMDAVGLGTRSPENSPIVMGSMLVGSVLASAGCGAPVQGSIREPFSQQDKHDHTAAVEPKSCRQKSPNLPHCANGEGADDGGSSKQSSKVSSDEGLSAHATVTPGFDRISDVLPTDAFEPGHLPECITTQDTAMISQPDSRKAHRSALQHERGEKVNQDLKDVCANIRPVEKDHAHGVLTLQSASALLSVNCNGANHGSKSETNLQPGTAATEDRMALEEQTADKPPLEVSGANKANQALHDDGSMMKNNTVNGGLTVQTAPVSQNCNVTLHDKTSEANCFSEQKNEKSRTDVEKDNCRTSIPRSSKDRDRERAKKTSNEEKSKDTSPEISVCSKDQDIDDTLEGLSQQDLCIKCGKEGELLTCSDCSLAAHASCFGSSVTFQGTDLFYCPVCFCKKAREAYLKAKKIYFEAKVNVAAYIGTAQVSKQYDEELNGVQQGAAKRDEHFNGSDMSKRNSIHRNEAYGLAHRDEEPHQPRKKQKINARGNDYPKEVLTEKVPFQNFGPTSMNKHSVLQNNSKTRVEDPEKKQSAGDEETHKEAGNDKSSDERTASSQRGCDPLNQDDEAHQEDSHTASNQSGGKRSSPPWCNMRQNKKRLHERESAVPRKRSSVRPQKRYSNPVAPLGRRTKLIWTAEEEAILREAMEIFTPQDDAPIPWIRILEYGHHVFHKTRLAPDLKDKWRNMMKKAGAGK